MRKVRVCLLTITVLCLWSLMLTGCRGGEKPPGQTGEAIRGENYDTGQFQVLVPEPWRVFPIEDPFAEGRPIKTDCVFLRKGGRSDWHVSEKPYIRIACFPPQEQRENQSPENGSVHNVRELAPIELDGRIWNGYTADDYQGKANIGTFAFLWMEDGVYRYEATIWLESGGESISPEDGDVRAILASIRPGG